MQGIVTFLTVQSHHLISYFVGFIADSSLSLYEKPKQKFIVHFFASKKPKCEFILHYPWALLSTQQQEDQVESVITQALHIT